jgi:bifunctional non-homologous end joining protein LigD
MGSLGQYWKKRKFEETPEPRGKTEAGKGDRFVVQEHHARRLHYDFRLEIDGVLKSWAVPKGPSLNPADKRLAIQTEDHPLEYATFHGTIPAGHYGAGEVKIWDEGHFEPEGSLSAREQLDRGELKFTLHGQKLRGSFVLVKLRNRGAGYKDTGKEWLLIKHRDDVAMGARGISRTQGPTTTAKPVATVVPAQKASTSGTPDDGQKRTSGASRKISSKNKLKMPAGARKAPMPQKIRPALAMLTQEPFSDPEWLFEVKWDGVRTLTELRQGKVQMWSRSDRNITHEYPELADLGGSIDARDAWIDGEIVVLDKHGRSDFQRLQLRFGVQRPSPKLIEEVPVVYYLFDLLYLDGYDLREVPLIERKNLLKQIVRENARVRYSDHVLERGKELYEIATQQHLEGIVAKKTSTPYPSGRSSSWLKIKLDKDLDAVVGGWTDPRGAREYFGALLLGLYEGDNLEYIGSVGSGFSAGLQAKLWPRLQNLRVSEYPFSSEPSTREQAYWIKPELVARVRFGNWTEDRHLRQPRFLGLQEDRDPKSCVFEDQTTTTAGGGENEPHTKSGEEQPAKGGVRTAASKKGQKTPTQRSSGGDGALNTPKRIEAELANGTSDNIYVEIDGHRLHFTNLNKIYFPKDGYRKRDLLSHYLWAAPMVLPFLKDRPLVLRRYPNGIEESAFFQKDAAKETPDWVKTVSIVAEDRGRTVRYICANDTASLLYLANLGCIDQNPWSSRYDEQDHPDYVFFDLDPSEGTTFATVIKFAKLFLETLEKLEITAFAKTSGATGFHIYIPIEPRYTYEQARLFVQAVASIVSRKSPGVLTSERTVRKRARGSIYVDAHQNSRGQSLACAYSVRAFEHAPVSAPVRLSELRANLQPEKWNIKSIRARVEKVGDLWSKFWNSRQQLETLLKHSNGET